MATLAQRTGSWFAGMDASASIPGIAPAEVDAAGWRFLIGLPTPTSTPPPTATATATSAAACVGGCNASGEVAISELITGVNIARGGTPLAACPSVDASGDGEAGGNELIQAVNNALNGCL